MRIDSSGNVGIGETSPDKQLHIKDSGTVGIVIESTDNAQNLDIDFYNNSGSAAGRIRYAEGSGALSFMPNQSTESVVFRYDGNVGIGTTSPSFSAGTGLEISRAGAATLRVTDSDGTTGSTELVQVDADGYLLTRQSGSLILGTNDTERMRIDSSGNLLVGTTSLGDVNNIVNGHLFEAANSTAGEGAVGVYNNTGTANCPALLVLNRDTSTDSTNRFVQFYADVTSSGATAMGGIVGNGASNVQFATLSDEREKENITPVANVLDKLMNLNVVSFDWKKNDEHVKAGFIAQNVEKHFPEYVIENIANDGEEPRKGTTGGMSAGYIAVLTKAIQEQQAQIESLKSEIAKLSGE